MGCFKRIFCFKFCFDFSTNNPLYLVGLTWSKNLGFFCDLLDTLYLSFFFLIFQGPTTKLLGFNYIHDDFLSRVPRHHVYTLISTSKIYFYIYMIDSIIIQKLFVITKFDRYLNLLE